MQNNIIWNQVLQIGMQKQGMFLVISFIELTV